MSSSPTPTNYYGFPLSRQTAGVTTGRVTDVEDDNASDHSSNAGDDMIEQRRARSSALLEQLRARYGERAQSPVDPASPDTFSPLNANRERARSPVDPASTDSLNLLRLRREHDSLAKMVQDLETDTHLLREDLDEQAPKSSRLLNIAKFLGIISISAPAWAGGKAVTNKIKKQPSDSQRIASLSASNANLKKNLAGLSQKSKQLESSMIVGAGIVALSYLALLARSFAKPKNLAHAELPKVVSTK